MRNRIQYVALAVALFFVTGPVWAQTGKIAGTVTDAATGEPLPGVNVVIVGTQQGATTDTEGFYSILNVSPGTYDLRASFVGYAAMIREGVRVNIDLTTEVDFELQEQTEQLQEVTVQATEPVVKPDVSANVANISAEDMESLPVASVREVIGLQAGVSGMSIRGGGADEVAFLVDGQSTRDGRTNSPFTGISYTAVDEVQVQTGGFNAEYGNVRSGLVNVVTREGPRDHYTADVLLRYSPVQRKHFGPRLDDPNSYYMRPYLDEDVAWEGTSNGAWDKYLQDQYPEFQGWNSVAQNHGLTPEEAREVFRWYRRKDLSTDDPDYDIDGSVGGPVPLLSAPLGNLRFFGSFRQTQSAYIVPQMRDAYRDRLGQLKLTSDIASNMKLTLHGLYSRQAGVNPNSQGWPNMLTGAAAQMANRLGEEAIFADGEWSMMDVTRHRAGGKLTHTLGPNTFYEVKMHRMYSDYFTRPMRERDPTVINTIGSMELNEAPFGWEREAVFTLTGMGMGTQAQGRDTSNVAVWTGSYDITSQLNQYSQMKAGLEYIYSNYHTNYGQVNKTFVNNPNPKYRWDRTPRQAAAYAQNKLEFEGMIANIGLRLDYFHASGDWYSYDPYTRAFTASFGPDSLEAVLESEPSDRLLALSPRLGISFPVTANSKLFLNYGHFRQMLDPNNLFMVQEINPGAVGRIGNPNHPMPKTIAYEVGYEHNLFNTFLLRLTGYYKDISDQPRWVGFTSIDGQVDYETSFPLNYADIRGAEITLRKNRGRWVRGFANFTYMARKQGNFGFGQLFENRVEQREFERRTRGHYQYSPVPQPYARFNIEFLTPPDFGPDVLGLDLLGDWHLNWLGNWRSGNVFTWAGGGGSIRGIENNVRWADYYNLDLRLSKNFTVGGGREVKFFMDVANLLNLRHMNRGSAFQGSEDFRSYMQSLHLPENSFAGVEGEPPYTFIPGDDRPGDFRTPGTAFVPIEITDAVEGVESPRTRPLYFEKDAGRYWQWRDDTWQEASSDFVESVLENKQYIDMPNLESFTFLNPRRVTFGLRVTL